jgi:hypothetical protein
VPDPECRNTTRTTADKPRTVPCLIDNSEADVDVYQTITDVPAKINLNHFGSSLKWFLLSCPDGCKCSNKRPSDRFWQVCRVQVFEVLQCGFADAVQGSVPGRGGMFLDARNLMTRVARVGGAALCRQAHAYGAAEHEGEEAAQGVIPHF